MKLTEQADIVLSLSASLTTVCNANMEPFIHKRVIELHEEIKELHKQCRLSGKAILNVKRGLLNLKRQLMEEWS